MSLRPVKNYISDNARTEGEGKAQFERMVDNILEAPGGAVESELTIVTGSITPTSYLHSVDTQADASTDDLTNMVQSNHPEGRVVCIRNENAARAVTLKHNAGGSGQLRMIDEADLDLTTVGGYVFFTRRGTQWFEVLRGVVNAGGGVMQSINNVSPTGAGEFGIDPAGGSTSTIVAITNGVKLNNTHDALTNNPHSLTAAQVFNNSPLWDLDRIQGKDVDDTGRADGMGIVFKSGSDDYKHEVLPTVTAGQPDKYWIFSPRWPGQMISKSEDIRSISEFGRAVTFYFGSVFPDTNYFVEITSQLGVSGQTGFTYVREVDKKVGSIKIGYDQQVKGLISSEPQSVNIPGQILVQLWSSTTLPTV